MQCFLVPLGIKVQRHQSCLGKRKGIDWWKGEKKSQRKKSKIDSHRTVTAEYSSPDDSIKFSLKKKNHLAHDIISYYSQWLNHAAAYFSEPSSRSVSKLQAEQFSWADLLPIFLGAQNTKLLKILLIRMVLFIITVCQTSRDLRSVPTQAHTSKAWRKKVLFSDLAHSMHSKHNSTCNRERQYMQHYVLTFFPQALLGRTAVISSLCITIHVYCLRSMPWS